MCFGTFRFSFACVGLQVPLTARISVRAFFLLFFGDGDRFPIFVRIIRQYLQYCSTKTNENRQQKGEDGESEMIKPEQADFAAGKAVAW